MVNQFSINVFGAKTAGRINGLINNNGEILGGKYNQYSTVPEAKSTHINSICGVKTYIFNQSFKKRWDSIRGVFVQSINIQSILIPSGFWNKDQ
jgi:hypothetical protein